MDNKSLEISIEFMKEQMNRLNSSFEKISMTQAEMNKVLIENTVIVKEHERRSTAFEGWAKEASKTLEEIGHTVNKLHSNYSHIDTELTPIKEHVNKVSKIVNFLDGVPVVLKVTVLVFTIITSLYGAFVIVHTFMPRK